MGLNPEQKRAVDYVAGPLLVLAGAGSGKTRVITHKIAALVGRHGMPASRVLAVTFTNKAAREMRGRVATLMGSERAAEVRISTFHRLGLDILRREYAGVGHRRNFSVLDAADSRALLKETLLQDAAESEAVIESCRAGIANWKNDLVTPEAAERLAADDLERVRARQYAAYQKALRCYNAVDFDDLLLLPVQLFNEQERSLERWRDRAGYLLVDEYQDTNRAQYQLMLNLVGDRGQLTVVGDDDQSIYAWRGARPENLKILAADFPDLEVIKLEQNYRSTRGILGAANALIANNAHVFEKRLWSKLGEGDPIRVMRARDPRDEADRVVMEIQRLAIGRGARWQEIAILYRSNHQARPVEQALRARGIPCRVAGGPSFFDRPEIRDLTAYMRLAANPNDDIAFMRIVNVPRREIGSTTIGRLADYAAGRGQTLFDASLEAGLHGVMSAPAVTRLARFSRTILRWQEAAERGRSADELATEIVEEIGYRQWLREACRDRRHEERCLENVDEFIEWLRRLAHTAEEGRLIDVLSRLALMDMLDRQEGDTGDDAVSLMTLHAAKGLEFPHVFLVGIEEDLLPHRSSVESDDIEEERRLAYVGMTRAMRGLTITYARRRSRYGETEECVPSRFLKELPSELVEWEGREPDRTPEERRERGRAAISDLRRMLSDS
jgi:ATP-dependent DNA helicase Rep